MGRLDSLIRRLGDVPRLALPDIPEGYVRLTHVMPDRSREILASGEPFIYRKHGLGGTTDAYGDNAHIEYLARTGDPLGPREDGSPSGWSRNAFGDHMALMDLPADAHKRIHGYLGFDDPIPNAAIVGFVDRKAMQFAPNPRYDRAAIDAYGQQAIERIRQLIGERAQARFGHRPQGDAQPEVWVGPRLSPPGPVDIW